MENHLLRGSYSETAFEKGDSLKQIFKRQRILDISGGEFSSPLNVPIIIYISDYFTSVFDFAKLN